MTSAPIDWGNDDRRDMLTYYENQRLTDGLAEAIGKKLSQVDRVHTATVLPHIRRQRRSVVDSLAAQQIADLINAQRRAAVLKLERAAEVKAEAERERQYLTDGLPSGAFVAEGYKHGSMNQQTGAVLRGCECVRCSKVREAEAEIDHRFFENIKAATDEYARTLKIEWARELLDAGFALPDGTRVLWGDATIDQHRTRRDMLERNGVANLEAAGRHRAAIDAIESAKVATLREALS